MKKQGGPTTQGCSTGQVGGKGEPQTSPAWGGGGSGGTAPSIRHMGGEENEKLREKEEEEKQPFYLCLSTSENWKVSPPQDILLLATTANDLAL